MEINFELYKIFYLTAKSGSFSEAAQKLYISQSAVSQAIKNLEEKIGEQLFFRKPRNVKLTNEGQLLFKHIEQAYNFIKAGENKIYEMQNMNYGEIRIGVSDTVCKYHVIPQLENFNRLYPKIKIRVINRTSSQIINLLKNSLVDFGIVTLPVQDNNIKVQDFTNVEDIFIASNKYSNLHNRSISLKELSKYPLLMLDKNSSTRRNLDIFLSQQGIEIAPEIELESIDLLVEFAKIGLGIACVLRESALSAMERKDVFEVKTNEKLPVRELGIISMKDMPLSQASNKFIEILKYDT
jgi:DNA-binding transcriptional LysR family regulator